MRFNKLSVLAIALALTALAAGPVLAKPAQIAPAQAGPTPTPTAEEEPTTDGASNVADEDDLAMLLRLNPPPVLSVREQGITEVPCEIGAPTGADEIEGETYVCGILTVPVDWHDPASPNIDLRYIVVKAAGNDPVPDPLVYLAGGPGQPSTLTPIAAYAKVREGRDFIGLDQRGAGQSQRLGLEECLALAVQDESAQDQLAMLVEFIQQPEADAGAPAATEVDFDAEVHQLCSRQFAAQGIDLDAFTSEQTVFDLVALLQALGYDSFNIHGESYGTRLAMTLMAMLPEIEDAPTLRSVVLDSTLPPSVYLLSSLPRLEHDQVLQLLDDCAGDEQCRTAFPNLAHRLADLLAALEDAPLIIDEETVTLADVVDVLTDLTASRAGYMPLMIAELQAGTADTYVALRDRTVGTDIPEGAVSFDMSDPVQAFMANAMRYLGADGDTGPVFEFLIGISNLLGQEEPYAALQAFLNETYTDDALTALTALFTELAPEDFDNSSYVQGIRTEMEAAAASEPTPEELAARQFRGQKTLSLAGIAYFLNMNIHCNEDYQFERLEDGINAFNDLTFPQLADLEFTRGQSTLCATWPVATAPIEVKNPVSSAVPTLILQGAYDTRTPVYMGRRAARELANSTLVIVPQQGHEVWTNANNCAGQIAAAFVVDPEAELDLSCLDGRLPQWVLPQSGVDSEMGMETENVLIGRTWQWIGFTSPAEEATSGMPELYQIVFQDDGTLSVTADCNQAMLGYNDDRGALTVEAGPTTLALCGPDSRSEAFIGYLGAAVRYFFEDGDLFIDLFADGGTLQFAPAE